MVFEWVVRARRPKMVADISSTIWKRNSGAQLILRTWAKFFFVVRRNWMQVDSLDRLHQGNTGNQNWSRTRVKRATIYSLGHLAEELVVKWWWGWRKQYDLEKKLRGSVDFIDLGWVLFRCTMELNASWFPRSATSRQYRKPKLKSYEGKTSTILQFRLFSRGIGSKMVVGLT
jgi:hypothetical protein